VRLAPTCILSVNKVGERNMEHNRICTPLQRSHCSSFPQDLLPSNISGIISLLLNEDKIHKLCISPFSSSSHSLCSAYYPPTPPSFPDCVYSICTGLSATTSLRSGISWLVKLLAPMLHTVSVTLLFLQTHTTLLLSDYHAHTHTRAHTNK
jgi:hypothetical protein